VSRERAPRTHPGSEKPQPLLTLPPFGVDRTSSTRSTQDVQAAFRKRPITSFPSTTPIGGTFAPIRGCSRWKSYRRRNGAVPLDAKRQRARIPQGEGKSRRPSPSELFVVPWGLRRASACARANREPGFRSLYRVPELRGRVRRERFAGRRAPHRRPHATRLRAERPFVLRNGGRTPHAVRRRARATSGVSAPVSTTRQRRGPARRAGYRLGLPATRSKDLVLEILTKRLEHRRSVEVRMPLIAGCNTAPEQVAQAAALLRRLDVGQLTPLRYDHFWEAKLPRLATRQTPLRLPPFDETQGEAMSSAFIRSASRRLCRRYRRLPTPDCAVSPPIGWLDLRLPRRFTSR